MKEESICISDESKCLIIRVQSVNEEWSLMLAECTGIDGNKLLVVFNKSQALQLDLKEGVHLQVHPPW